MNDVMGASSEMQSFSPWTHTEAPLRILVIRFQALGDVALTLPAVAGLRKLYPEAQIDFLTQAGAGSLPGSVEGIDDVIEIPPGIDRWDRLKLSILEGRSAWRQHYDVVLDLQRNRMSRMIRRMALPEAWGEFDRFASKSASERVVETFRRTGFSPVEAVRPVSLRESVRRGANDLLCAHGAAGGTRLIVLNPAGLWPTRNWPLSSYVALARLWLEHEDVKFLVAGTGRIFEKAAYLSQYIGRPVINLAGKTTLETAYGLMARADGMITEDSGLMHMAWSLGVPIVALFGSSRHVWSAPTGPGTVTFHSGDLSCGQCMSPSCARGDLHCLVRRSPAEVFEAAMGLLGARRRAEAS